MNSKCENMSDRELLRIYLADPKSPLGRESKEELEYRKYREVKKQNAELIKLTRYMTCAIVAQFLVAFAQLVAWIKHN